MLRGVGANETLYDKTHLISRGSKSEDKDRGLVFWSQIFESRTALVSDWAFFIISYTFPWLL
jgi:hypothetical protein